MFESHARQMERRAIGFCRMSAAEFSQLTPREFSWRYEAEIERENREFERMAQLAIWVIQPFLGKNRKPLKVSDLLKRRPMRMD